MSTVGRCDREDVRLQYTFQAANLALESLELASETSPKLQGIYEEQAVFEM